MIQNSSMSQSQQSIMNPVLAFNAECQRLYETLRLDAMIMLYEKFANIAASDLTYRNDLSQAADIFIADHNTNPTNKILFIEKHQYADFEIWLQKYTKTSVTEKFFVDYANYTNQRTIVSQYLTNQTILQLYDKLMVLKNSTSQSLLLRQNQIQDLVNFIDKIEGLILVPNYVNSDVGSILTLATEISCLNLTASLCCEITGRIVTKIKSQLQFSAKKDWISQTWQGVSIWYLALSRDCYDWILLMSCDLSKNGKHYVLTHQIGKGHVLWQDAVLSHAYQTISSGYLIILRNLINVASREYLSSVVDKACKQIQNHDSRFRITDLMNYTHHRLHCSIVTRCLQTVIAYKTAILYDTLLYNNVQNALVAILPMIQTCLTSKKWNQWLQTVIYLDDVELFQALLNLQSRFDFQIGDNATRDMISFRRYHFFDLAKSQYSDASLSSESTLCLVAQILASDINFWLILNDIITQAKADHIITKFRPAVNTLIESYLHIHTYYYTPWHFWNRAYLTACFVCHKLICIKNLIYNTFN